MFERFTEKLRRVIFFARYEASQFGSPYIETQHLLLGLLREDPALVHRFQLSPESIRAKIEKAAVIREHIATSVDLPLSNECKRVLSYMTEEADALGHKHIGTEHLLLGLLREEKSFAAELLRESGLRLKEVRKKMTSKLMDEPADKAATLDGMVEIVEGNEPLLTTTAFDQLPLPRTGEELVLQSEGEEPRTYKVETVRYILDSESQLQKIQICVKWLGAT